MVLANTRKEKPNKKRKGGLLRRIAFVFMTLILIGITTMAMCGGAALYYINHYIKPQAAVDINSLSMKFNSVVYYTDKDGEDKILQTLKSDENREWVDGKEIPEELKQAFVAIEDKRFYEHNGVDWRRTFGAALNWILPTNEGYGGSTITQQLIKNITDDDDYSVKRKITEIIRAQMLEEQLDKDSILELYMNEIYFGEQAYGVQTAARTYFDKEVKDLNLAECAVIAGMTQNPVAYDPYDNPEATKERQLAVLGQMKEQGYITQKEYSKAKKQELEYKRGQTEAQEGKIYSYFTDMVISDVVNDLVEQKEYSYEYAKALVTGGGLSIYTTVDLDVQHTLESVYERSENFPQATDKDGEQVESAMIVLDPKTGNILGVVGGRGKKDDSLVLNRATQTPRSPGSTIKPLSVYAPALDAKLITPYTAITDMPAFADDGNAWPKNENRVYSGQMTVMNGVAKSTNTIAVNVLKKLTLDSSYDFMTQKLGFTSLVDDDHSYGALALGGLTEGVTVREMAQGYTALANYGKYSEAKSYTKVLDADGKTILSHEDDKPKQVFERKRATPQYVNNLLTNAVQNGTGQLAQIDGFDVAGKTGTTSDDVDRWFAGYTPYYVGVCWVGFDSAEGLPDLSPNPAVTAWAAVMRQLHANKDSKYFEKSEGFVEAAYCIDSGLSPTQICRSDVRGGHVQYGSFYKSDVPEKTCSMHQWYRGTSLLDLTRKFKLPITVTDEYYCFHSNNKPIGKGEQVNSPNGYYTTVVDRRIEEERRRAAEAAARAAAEKDDDEKDEDKKDDDEDNNSSYHNYTDDEHDD